MEKSSDMHLWETSRFFFLKLKLFYMQMKGRIKILLLMTQIEEQRDQITCITLTASGQPVKMTYHLVSKSVCDHNPFCSFNINLL